MSGRDRAVGIATGYGLDGPGIKSRWEARFSAPVQTGPGAHRASYTMGKGSIRGVKRLGRGVHHPPQPSVEVEERTSFLPDPYFMITLKSKIRSMNSYNHIRRNYALHSY